MYIIYKIFFKTFICVKLMRYTLFQMQEPHYFYMNHRVYKECFMSFDPFLKYNFFYLLFLNRDQ